MYITVSNGIGGALFLNGEVYYGAYGNAGEIGQCVVVENGRQAFEEVTGTLEMYTSTSGLVKNYLEIGGSEWVNGQRLNGQVLAKRAAQREMDALLAFEKEGYYLGRVIASACTLLDPEKVILGGGLSLAYEFFRDSLESTVKKEFRRSAGLKIESSVLGYDGALMGAAAIAMRGLQRVTKGAQS